MHADFSVELGPDDPVLDLPWISDEPSVRYYDLKNYPELVRQIPEAAAYPALGTFLTRVNTPTSLLETAKCDVWQSQEMSPEEEIFGADQKFVAYVDLVFVDENLRGSFEEHEDFAKEICQLLSRAPDTLSTIELIIRRGYFHARRSVARDEEGHIAESTGSGLALHVPRISNAVIGTAEACHKNVYPPLKGPAAGPDSEVDPNPDGDQNQIALHSGFYFTVYVTGFGSGDRESQRNWEIAIALLQHALMQKRQGQ